jgi:hypothetical protein
MLKEKFQGQMKFYTAAEGMTHDIISCHAVGHEYQQYADTPTWQPTTTEILYFSVPGY